jgi:hypothetical protein
LHYVKYYLCRCLMLSYICFCYIMFVMWCYVYAVLWSCNAMLCQARSWQAMFCAVLYCPMLMLYYARLC